MPDGDGKPTAEVGEEPTVKVDTGARAHLEADLRRDHLILNLQREITLLSARLTRAEILVLEALRRANAAAQGQEKN